MKVAQYIDQLATQMRDEGYIDIEDVVYTIDQFPAGFWRKLAKEVNYLQSNSSDAIPLSATDQTLLALRLKVARLEGELEAADKYIGDSPAMVKDIRTAVEGAMCYDCGCESIGPWKCERVIVALGGRERNNHHQK
jgi:hypothetical protein